MGCSTRHHHRSSAWRHQHVRKEATSLKPAGYAHHHAGNDTGDDPGEKAAREFKIAAVRDNRRSARISELQTRNTACSCVRTNGRTCR